MTAIPSNVLPSLPVRCLWNIMVLIDHVSPLYFPDKCTRVWMQMPLSAFTHLPSQSFCEKGTHGPAQHGLEWIPQGGWKNALLLLTLPEDREDWPLVIEWMLMELAESHSCIPAFIHVFIPQIFTKFVRWARFWAACCKCSNHNAKQSLPSLGFYFSRGDRDK